MNHLWRQQARNRNNDVAAQVAGINFSTQKGRRCMYLLHLRPLFVGLPIFVLDGLVLLEPRDLVREQTRRNLRHAAADLRGGEEYSYGKVERLFARVGAGGTGIVGQEL